MDARRTLAVLAGCLLACGMAAAQNSAEQDPAGQNSAQPATPAGSGQSDAGSSAPQKSHAKSGSAHHTVIEEEEGPPPELAKAEDAIQKKNFTDAQELLERVVEKDPSSYVAWFDLGFVENELANRDGSIAAYRKSVEAKPDVFESNLNLGLQLAKSRDADAEKYLRAATQLKPTSHVAEGKARAWISLAHVLETKQPDEAIAAYREAAALQPKDIEPHLSAGLLLEGDNRFFDAEEEYKKALAIDPGSRDAAIGLANIYMRGRRFPEAEAALRKVVADEPTQAAVHVQLGRVLAAEGKNDAAIAELETGKKLAPNDATVDRELADLYFLAGQNDKAQAAYRALIAVHANDAELHDGLGKSLMRGKDFAHAEQEFLAALKLKPDDADTFTDLAFASSENKDYAMVIKALDARAKLTAEIPIAYFLRASAYDHLRDVKRAVENYELFLKTANGKYSDQEWQAKHRLIALEPKR